MLCPELRAIVRTGFGDWRPRPDQRSGAGRSRWLITLMPDRHTRRLGEATRASLAYGAQSAIPGQVVHSSVRTLAGTTFP